MSKITSDKSTNIYPEKIVFIGSYACDKYFEAMFSSGLYQQMAANIVQEYYINALAEELKLQIDVLSSLVTIPFPIANKIFVKSDNLVTPSIKVLNVGFFNFKYVNIFFQEASLQTAADRWANDNKGKSVLVVVYAMRLPFLSAAARIKRILPSAIVINIIPDLPVYMHSKQTFFRRLLSKLNQKILIEKQRCVNGFVLYTEAMKEVLDVSDKPWIVNEGIYDCKRLVEANSYNLENSNFKKKVNTVVYTGGVEESYGLEILVRGFIKANIPSLELHIYGKGSYLEKLLKYSEKYPNIKYCGFLIPSQIYTVISKADLLINPRPSAEFTKYSCPSKTLEYMATGVPVLMTKLGGIPKEYYDYVYTIEDDTDEGIATALKKVFSSTTSERMMLGEAAKKYICENKSAKIQVNRLLDMARNIKSKQ